MASKERRDLTGSEQLNDMVQAIKDYPPEIQRILIQRVIDAGGSPDESR